jgi:hypothetical protein
MSCNCNYSFPSSIPCVSCDNVENVNGKAVITQKRIWNQVRVPASMYLMNKGALTSASNRIINGNNVNWNQSSDQVLAAIQTVVRPSHGNSLKRTVTSHRPGAASPGGTGVDVKHDSYARFLNRKKALNFKTQTSTPASTPTYGNKTKSINLLSQSANCCS